MDEQDPQDHPTSSPDDAAANGASQPSTSPNDETQAQLVRHATPPLRDRGRMSVIAACATLAGVIVGFALSTAVYRDAAHCRELSPVPAREFVVPMPQAPPPGRRWHQHGDRHRDHRGCDAPRRRGHWSPPPPPAPAP